MITSAEATVKELRSVLDMASKYVAEDLRGGAVTQCVRWRGEGVVYRDCELKAVLGKLLGSQRGLLGVEGLRSAVMIDKLENDLQTLSGTPLSTSFLAEPIKRGGR